MEKRILDVIEKRYSAVIGNLNPAMLNHVIEMLEANEYPYIVLSSTSTLATHRMGFPQGVNEYIGSESFVKLRLQAEVRLINQTFDLKIGNYYLDYVVEWVYNTHVMDTPLNYLDADGRLFQTLGIFFQEKNDLNPNIEDQVAVKLMELFAEFFKDDISLPIFQARNQLFTNRSVVLVSEESGVKSDYIINSIKLYHHDFKILEASNEEDKIYLEYINFNN